MDVTVQELEEYIYIYIKEKRKTDKSNIHANNLRTNRKKYEKIMKKNCIDITEIAHTKKEF